MAFEQSDHLHTSHVGHVAWLILAVLIGALLGFYVGVNWQKAQNAEDTASAVAPSVNTSSVTNTPDWTKYSNTKLGFSFKYPSTTKIVGVSENGSTDLTITTTVDGIKVYPVLKTSSDSVFLISSMSIALTPTAIKLDVGKDQSQNVTVTSNILNNISGYKAAFPNDNYSFYYVKNRAGSVLKISVINDSADATNILSTFKLSQ